jgi:hypothetical protein
VLLIVTRLVACVVLYVFVNAHIIAVTSNTGLASEVYGNVV